MVDLKQYKKIVGREVLDKLCESRKAFCKHILSINSTYMEWGITVLLNTAIPLFNELD